MNLNAWYEKGKTADNYMDSLEVHKEGFQHIYDNFKLPEDKEFKQAIQNKNLRVVVLAEPWCGHCMLNIPILLRLTEDAGIPIRILPRDEHIELMDQYLTNGNRTIPIFIFIDQDGNEVTKWGPISKITKEFVDNYRQDLPAKDAEDYQEKFEVLIKFTTKAFRENTNLWNGSYESIKQALV